MVFATIFLVAFVIIGGVVMYLSRTIDHGEARFDSSGHEIRDKAGREEPTRHAQRRETNETPNQVNNDE